MEIEENVVDGGDLKELTKNFMQNLNEENFVGVDFEESLNVTLVKTGEAIGNFNIKAIKCASDEKGYDIIFEITAECSGNVEQQVSCSFNANAQIIYADGYLQTKLQIHTEYVKCGELRVNKVTETRLQDDGTLIINRKINDEDELDIKLTADESKTYLSDGASLLLMRILSRMDWNQQLEFITLDGDGQICPVIYYPAGTMLLPSDANPTESTSLVKIGRELHRDGKIDHWMFSLFRNGELYSWIHKNSPVYMEFKNSAVQDSPDPESVPIDEKIEVQNEIEMAVENEKIDNPKDIEAGEEIQTDKIDQIDQNEFNDQSVKEKVFFSSSANFNDDHHALLSTIDEEEHLSVSQNYAGNNVQQTSDKNHESIQIDHSSENIQSSGSTMHLRGLFGSSFDGKYEKIESIKIEPNQPAENLISNDLPVYTTERTTTSGSTMHLRGLFDSDPDIKEEKIESENKNPFDDIIRSNAPNDNLTDRTMASGSTMHIRGLFDSSFNLKEGKNDEIGEDTAKNQAETEMTARQNQNEIFDENEQRDDNSRFGTDSNSKGIFASYKNEMESQNIGNHTDRTMSSGSTMHIRGLFDSSFSLKSEINGNVKQIEEKIDENEEAEQELNTDEKIDQPGDEETNTDSSNPVPCGEDSLPNLYPTPKHTIDNFDHPTPIPEEDEGNDQKVEPTNENRENNPLDNSEKRRDSFKFPLEMFDSKSTLETIGRGNSLPQELEPDQNVDDNGNSLNKSTSIFPPIISPRGDKRMMKLMSRRLSSLMKSFDSSAAELEDESSAKSPRSKKEKKSKQTNLEHESDYHSFNRFNLLSREASNVTSNKQDSDSNEKNVLIENEDDPNEKENGTDNQLLDTADALNESQASTTISRLGQDLKPKSPDEGMGSSDMSAISDGHKSPPLLPSFESFNDYHKFFKSECQSYIETHTEIHKILGEFLQALLIARPEKVLPFASAYFQFVANRNKE